MHVTPVARQSSHPGARWTDTIPYELLCGVPVRARFVNRHEG
jgi:hypothetical protein